MKPENIDLYINYTLVKIWEYTIRHEAAVLISIVTIFQSTLVLHFACLMKGKTGQKESMDIRQSIVQTYGSVWTTGAQPHEKPIDQ